MMAIQTTTSRNKSQKNKNYSKANLMFGLLLGVVLSLVLFFRYLLGFAPNAPISRTETIVALSVMFVLDICYVCLKQRETETNFSKTLLRCWWINIIASVLYGVFLYVYAYSIDIATPSYVERCTNTMLDSLAQNGQELSDVKAMPISYLVMYSILGNVIVGFVASLITCLVSKCLGFTRKSK
ncbi:MAG: DUF4199 domain-containing protein [Bacteroidales bacterium]|nr:DUF4199 domain-containing protein [Bacteroidales bacterium]